MELKAHQRTDLRPPEEQAFYKTLAERKVEIEAFIVRSHREWAAATYVFRFKKAGKWSDAQYLPWDDKTFGAVLDIVGKGK